jgi:hypothetical protein
MLGKPSRRTEKRLQEQGVRASAVVLEIATSGMAVTNGAEGVVSNPELVRKARLRVEPDGRPAVEIEKRFRFPQLAVPSAGMRIPVIFDPEDTDTVILDQSPEAHIQSALQSSGISQEGMEKVRSLTSAALSGASRDELRAMAAASFQPMPMPMPAPNAEQTKLDQLEQLAGLRERGVLTDEEFAAQKAQILGS